MANLRHISENPSKHALYSLLAHEVSTLKGVINAITLPSDNQIFERRLSGSVKSFTFIERDKKVAKKIRENFHDLPHNLVLGAWPKLNDDISNAYRDSNFVWLDLMGRYLKSYDDAIKHIMATCLREEMVFAITVGCRGGSDSISDPSTIMEILKGIIEGQNWGIERAMTCQYKSAHNVAMSCIIFRLSNPNNDAKSKRRRELENSIAVAKKELAQLESGSHPLASIRDYIAKQGGTAKQGVTAKQGGGIKAWETRRKRYGYKGLKNKNHLAKIDTINLNEVKRLRSQGLGWDAIAKAQNTCKNVLIEFRKRHGLINENCVNASKKSWEKRRAN